MAHEDMRLQFKVSDMILGVVRGAIAGEFADTPNGDVQSVCEALARRIIAEVMSDQTSEEGAK